MFTTKYLNSIVKKLFMLTTSGKQSSNNRDHTTQWKTEMSILLILNILTPREWRSCLDTTRTPLFALTDWHWHSITGKGMTPPPGQAKLLQVNFCLWRLTLLCQTHKLEREQAASWMYFYMLYWTGT